MHALVFFSAILIAYFVIPMTILVWPRIPNKPDSNLLRWFLAAIGSWGALCVFYFLSKSTRPPEQAPIVDGGEEYDLVTGLAILWGAALLYTSPYLLLAIILKRNQRRRESTSPSA